jgi:signal transduction histidine kinase
VEIDPMRLEQVLVNLVTNAAKFTEPGGRIGIGVEASEREVRVRVRDTGAGLLPEMLPHLFDLFAQAENGSRGGLGVGLHLAHRLVRLHGGDLIAQSDGPGKGSEFLIRLPIAESSGKEAGLGSARSRPEVCV